ncbi:MAG: Fic family protein [Polaribacter sp.]|jgi:Fic family protein
MPVGYQRDFLDAYHPNKTCYLSESLRRQLHKIVKTTPINEAAATYSRAILNRLLIDLSWPSSHLEGSTYSRLDTRELIEHETSAQGKAAIETQMILNHKSAIELLVENIDTAEFNRYTLMNLHSALSTPVQIENTLNEVLNRALQIADPFEQSFFMMVHLPYVQPFADINKRTFRLAANLPLFRA